MLISGFMTTTVFDTKIKEVGDKYLIFRLISIQKKI